MSNYDPNLPAGLPSDFNDEKEPKMKICPECNGKGQLWGEMYHSDCDICKGEGEVPMTDEEIQEEKEERNEPNNL